MVAILLVLGSTIFFIGSILGYQVTKAINHVYSENQVLSYESKNLESISTQTPTPIETSALSLTPTETPTPQSKSDRPLEETLLATSTTSITPTTFPTTTIALQTPFTSQEINGFIDRFAVQYKVDSNVLRHIATCESGFNPLAFNKYYAGLYQFSPNAWVKYRTEMGEDTNPDLRFNAEEATQTAVFVISTNRTYIWPNCTP